MPTVAVHQSPWAVLSDLDGTLLDTERHWIIAAREVLLAHEIVASAELLARDEGATIEQVARMLQQTISAGASVGDITIELEQRVASRLQHGVTWQPGARELLAALEAVGVPVALVTSSPRRWVTQMLTPAELAYFDIVITVDDVSNPKPHPEPYLAAAEALGLATHRCVVIEDSPLGSLAAVRAGCPTVTVGHAESVGGALSVASLTELTPAVLLSHTSERPLAPVLL